MKPEPLHETPDCLTISDVLGRVGDKWSVLVISTLGEAPRRFSEVEREIPRISKKMLTSTLRLLERDGFVERQVTPTRPPRVDYALTPLGRELWKPVCALAHFARANTDRIAAARHAFDAAQDGDAWPLRRHGS